MKEEAVKINKLLDLSGKAVLVVGGHGGIGKALALAREGADVAVNCSTSVAAAGEIAGKINMLGRHAAIFQADMSSRAAVEDMVHEVLKQFGKIDILVNNAGMSVVGDYLESWLKSDK